MIRAMFVAVAVAVFFVVTPLWAHQYTIEDIYWGANANDDGDVIGELASFGISKMEVDFSGGFMNVEVYTPFYENIEGYGTEYGDLFISTDGWDPAGSADNNYQIDNAGNGEDWEYVFDTSAENLFQVNANTELTHAEDAAPANGGNHTTTSDGRDVYGGYIVRDGQEVLYESGGSIIGGDQSSFSDVDKGAFLEYAIDLSSLDISGETIGLKWSMTCANDSIEGSVPIPAPEPSTMLLLGSGLVGLAFYRRRKK